MGVAAETSPSYCHRCYASENIGSVILFSALYNKGLLDNFILSLGTFFWLFISMSFINEIMPIKAVTISIYAG